MADLVGIEPTACELNSSDRLEISQDLRRGGYVSCFS